MTKHLPTSTEPSPEARRVRAVGSEQFGGRGRLNPDMLQDHHPITHNFFVCEDCRGWWYQTNRYGYEWMLRKADKLSQLWGWEGRPCETCLGMWWNKMYGYPNHITNTGTWVEPQGYWIFNGKEEDWDDDQSELDIEIYKQFSPAPWWGKGNRWVQIGQNAKQVRWY